MVNYAQTDAMHVQDSQEARVFRSDSLADALLFEYFFEGEEIRSQIFARILVPHQ